MTTHLVALTATTKTHDGASRVQLNEAYVEAVQLAGLTPVIVSPIEIDRVSELLDAVAGLVLTGGEDIDPARYGEPRSEHSDEPHTARDATELAAVQLARARRIPTLAICRGLQIVNVAMGGTLVQDIPSECPTPLEHRAKDRRARVHGVRLEGDSALARVTGTTELDVNSSHHQSIGRVAPGLRVTAKAPDGIIEGAEWTGGDWWMLGVQWHPEEMMGDARDWDRGLFRAFAKRVREGG